MVHESWSSMASVVDLHFPPEQVPAVVPTVLVQEAAPPEAVLLVCVTCPGVVSPQSVVQGFLSSMSSVVDALQLPPEQVPAVVPTPPAQEGAAPHEAVLLECVTCPVVMLQLSVVHGFPSSIATGVAGLHVPPMQVPAAV